jgi:hypothetical protein
MKLNLRSMLAILSVQTVVALYSFVNAKPVVAADLCSKWIPLGAHLRGTSWSTCNGYKLVFQSDGNLVIYSPSSQPLWATGTWTGVATIPKYFLVGYSVQVATASAFFYSPESEKCRFVKWEARNITNPGLTTDSSRLVLQSDGNLVLYNSLGQAKWDSQTFGGRVSVFNAGQIWSSQQIAGCSYY